jgi:N-formylglutamate amidohydrolase
VTAPPAFSIEMPERQLAPVVYASPHSGTHYPPELLHASALSLELLRRSEDSFVDELFAAAPSQGAPLIRARYARVYLDPNREPWELDPAMFEAPLPGHVNSTSLRVAGGLGTIARIVSEGHEVYERKLSFADAERRIDDIYYPYHRALAGLITETRLAFGYCILIDCHSMPSAGALGSRDRRRRADIVLGDRFGTTCSPKLTEYVHSVLADQGLMVMRNNPYAGGFTTYHYGRPLDGVHTLQIEINRALYMDEARIEKGSGFTATRRTMTELIAALRRLGPEAFESQPAAAQ